MKNNILLFGAGRMGLRYIDICYKNKIKIGAIIDVNKKKINELKKKYPNSKTRFINFCDKKLIKEKFDCAIIATTADQRFDIVKFVHLIGIKKILIEKPLANSLKIAKNIISFCKKFKIKISVNHQMKFMDVYNYPIAISKKYNDPIRSMVVQTGNFGLGNNVIHYIEAFKYVLQAKPIYAYGNLEKKTINNPRGKKFKDMAGQIKLTDKNGKRFYIEFGSDLGHNITVIYSAKNFQLIVDELSGLTQLHIRKPKFFNKKTNLIGLPSKLINKKLKPLEIYNSTWRVLESLLSDKKNFVDAKSGLENMKIALAAINSSANNSQKTLISKVTYSSKNTYWA